MLLSSAKPPASPMVVPSSPGEASTGPSTALDTGPSTTLTTPERSRRGSAVFQSFKGFFFRKDSVLSKGPSTEPAPDVKPLYPLADPHDQNQADLARAELGDLAYEGRAHIPSEREHFAERNRRQESGSDGVETGESSTWYKDTDEWKNRDETPLSPRLSYTMTNGEVGAAIENPELANTTTNGDEVVSENPRQSNATTDSEDEAEPKKLRLPTVRTNLEADAAPNAWHRLRDHSPEPSGDKWQSRRHSSIRRSLENIFLPIGRLVVKTKTHKKKGKLPKKKNNGKRPRSPPSTTGPPFTSTNSIPIPRPPENTPSSSVLPLTRMHCFIPPTSEENELNFELTFEHEEIPHPSYLSISSSKSSIASKKLTAGMPSKSNSATPRPEQNEARPPTPPPGRPEVYPFSSNEALTTTSTSMSSLEDSMAPAGPNHPNTTHDGSAIVAAFTTLAINAYPPSLPIDIPTPTNYSRRSSNATAIQAERPFLALPHLEEAMGVARSGSTRGSELLSTAPTAPPTPSLAPITRASMQQVGDQALQMAGNSVEPPSYTQAPSDGEQRLDAGRGVVPTPDGDGAAT